MYFDWVQRGTTVFMNGQTLSPLLFDDTDFALAVTYCGFFCPDKLLSCDTVFFKLSFMFVKDNNLYFFLLKYENIFFLNY